MLGSQLAKESTKQAPDVTKQHYLMKISYIRRSPLGRYQKTGKSKMKPLTWEPTRQTPQTLGDVK